MHNRLLKDYNIAFGLLVLFLLTLACCSSDDKESNPLSSRESVFVGTWVLTKVTYTDLNGPHIMTPEEAGMAMTIKVNPDKTFSTTTTIAGETEAQSGTWNLSGDFIVLTSEGDTEMLPYTVEGNKFTITIYEQNGDVLNSRVLEFTKQ